MHSVGTRRMCTIPQTLSRVCMKGTGHETNIEHQALRGVQGKDNAKLELSRAHIPCALCSQRSIATLLQSCCYDLTTLFNTELEHAQSHQHTPVEWVWWINHRHAEQKCTICSASSYRPLIFEQFEASGNQVFINIIRLVVLTVRTEVYVKSGDFRTDDNDNDDDRRKNRPLRMRAG